LKGWVRTRRGNNQVAFIAVNDGSIIHNIQVVADLSAFPEETMKRVTTGSSISVSGLLVESMGKGQSVEIQASEILEVLGDSDPEVYPLQKRGILLNSSGRLPTCDSGPILSGPYSGSGMPWLLPSINFTTTKDFSTCIPPSLQPPMPKVPVPCSR
jgi:hypothetical protein